MNPQPEQPKTKKKEVLEFYTQVFVKKIIENK